VTNQTRRSVSISGRTYLRLKAFCARHEKSMSGYLEEIIRERLDDVGEPLPVVVEAPTAAEPGRATTGSRRKSDIDAIIAQHFTF
jgi:predicted DNA-binding protein